jgi:hypothetical protein
MLTIPERSMLFDFGRITAKWKLRENAKRLPLIFLGFVHRIYRIDIDPMMAGMIWIGGKGGAWVQNIPKR